MAEEIQDIADDGTNDWMEVNGREVTGWKENGESIQRSKLRVDTRKWLMAKMKPKRYGDAINTDITSKGERIMVMPLELINKNDTSSGTIRNS